MRANPIPRRFILPYNFLTLLLLVAPVACGAAASADDESCLGTPGLCGDAGPNARDALGEVDAGDWGDNTPPVYAGPSVLWTLEGSEAHATFELDEGDTAAEDAQTVTISAISTTDDSLVPLASVSVRCEDQGDGCRGRLVVSPVPGRTGSAQLLLRVSDGALTRDITIDLVVDGAPAGATLRYVSPDADGSGDGTRQAPWTMSQANTGARPGYTIILEPGAYPQGIAPARDGQPASPIRFVAEQRRQAVVVEPGSAGHLLNLAGRKNIEVVGIRFVSRGTTRLVTLDGADSVRIEDCIVFGRGLFNSAYFDIHNARNIDLIDSRFERAKQNLLRVRDVVNYRVLGTVVARAGHATMFNDTGLRNVIFRGSASMGIWGRASGFSGGPTRMLFERNVVNASMDAGRSAGSDFKLQGNGAIYRLNRVYDNGPALFVIRDYRRQAVINHLRLYNNVFHQIVDRAFWLNRAGRGTFGDVVLQNNVFLDNDRFGEGYHLRGSNVAGEVRLVSNLFFGQSANATLPPDVLGVSDEGNVYVDPGYESPGRRDYVRLRAGSVVPESGTPLTRTRSAGSGREIPVGDAYPFFDGFGFADEVGDLIQVGTARARVVRADWSQGTLSVDRDLSWTAGAPVSPAWEGESPPVGAYEEGDDLEHVAILSSAGTARPGESVSFELLGVASDARVVWHFGDEVRATGRVVEHAFAGPSDRYVVRARVDGGPSWQRAAMVLVVSNRGTSDPLVNLDFSIDDDTVRIKTDTWSRPLPDISRIDAPNGKALRIQVSADNGGLESRFYPLQGWDVAAHPYLVVSYNIDRGVSLRFGLEAFSVTGSLAKRTLDVNTLSLVADGAWHEAAIDVRQIREAFPDVTHLAGVFFTGPKGQGPGNGYAFRSFCVSATRTCPAPQ